MKLKFTNKQIAGILNEASEDYIVKAIKLLGGIHSDNIASSDMIKGILSTNKMRYSLKLNQSYDLGSNETDSLKLKDKIRFHEYWNRLSTTTDGRGFAFEGLVAGLFGGDTTAKLTYEDPENNDKNPISDIIISKNSGVKKISLKLVKDNKERYGIGSFLRKFNDFKNESGIDYETVKEFLMSEDSDTLKREFLDTCFPSDILYMFCYIIKEERSFNYVIYDIERVKDEILKNFKSEKPVSGKIGDNSLGLKINYSEEHTIKFPKVSKEEVDDYLPVDGGERDIDQVYDIFNDEVKKYLRPEVLAYIYSNKDEISNKLNSLNESDSFMNRRVDKVTFRKIVNPRVTLTVEKHPNGEIVSIDNPYKVRFPFQKGQVLNRGYETWAHTSGYEFSIDGRNFKGKPEKKKFGIPVSLLPPHLKNL